VRVVVRELLSHSDNDPTHAGINIALLATRQTKDKWDVSVTDKISGHKSCSAYDITSLFPLYIYPVKPDGMLFDSDKYKKSCGSRISNLMPSFVGYYAENLKMDFEEDGKGDLERTFGPEDVFDYMYAVFHSPTYRRRYAGFLKIDFPHLPLTSNLELFRALCGLGDELVKLHLMEKQGPRITSYPIAGDNAVEAVRYTEPSKSADKGRVWINREQYFEGVPPEVWTFHVGGYQVCQKWLKDRKGRKLTYDDLTHYQQVVSALAETIRLMSDLDEAIEAHGGWPIR
jgi:predicted helicase